MLQWHRNKAEVVAYQVDDQVLGAGEADDRDGVPGVHRVDRVVAPGSGDCADPLPHVAVGDGLEPRQQASRRSAGGGVNHELTGRSPSAGRSLIAIRQCLQDLREPQAWPAGRLDHSRVGLCGAELGVVDVQVGDPACEPPFPAFGQIAQAGNLMRNVTGHLSHLSLDSY